MIESTSKSNIIDYAILIGAIVYFVFPLDAIPDEIPGFGYIDDTALLSWAFKSAQNIISDLHITKANETAAKLLGNHFDADKAAKMTMKLIESRKK